MVDAIEDRMEATVKLYDCIAYGSLTMLVGVVIGFMLIHIGVLR